MNIHLNSTNQKETNSDSKKIEFRNVKRISDSTAVGQFFQQCRYKLLDTKEWNKLNLFYPVSKISLYDYYGFSTTRTAIKGDFIKIDYNPLLDYDNSIWLQIEDIKQSFEEDEKDEIFCLFLREAEKPNLGRNLGTYIPQSQCEIKLRRIVNTISLETKINIGFKTNLNSTESLNKIQNFPWDRLIKNTLSIL